MTQPAPISAEAADKLGKELIWHVDHASIDMTQIRGHIGRGANVNYDDSGLVALNVAASHGHLDAAAALLDAGADIDICPSGQYPPIIQAVREGKVDMVKLLLVRGAHAETVAGPVAAPPLHWCVFSGRAKCARVLLDHGVDLDMLGPSGLTALEHAQSLNKQDLIDMLQAEPLRRAEAKRLQDAVRAERITSVPEDTAIKAPRLKIGARGVKP